MSPHAAGSARRVHAIHVLRTGSVVALIVLGAVVTLGAIVVVALGLAEVLSLPTAGLVAAGGGVGVGLLFILGGLVGRSRRVEIEVDGATGRVDLTTRDLFSTSAKRTVTLAEIEHVAVTRPTDPDHAAQVVLVLLDKRMLSPTDSWVGDAQAAAASLATFLGKPLR